MQCTLVYYRWCEPLQTGTRLLNHSFGKKSRPAIEMTVSMSDALILVGRYISLGQKPAVADRATLPKARV